MSLALHEKIQLSAEDIKYLQKLFLQNAHSKLRLNLPSSSQDTKDPLTLRIVNMIENFIYEIFEMSKYSLVIDGEDMASVESLRNILNEPKEQIEPFDIELNQELRKVYQQVEQETLEVTGLRRDFPRKAQLAYKETLENNYDSKLQLVLDELQEQTDSQKENDDDGDGDDDHVLIARSREFINDYDEALKTLSGLKDQIPLQASEVDKLNELLKSILDLSQ